MQAQFSRTSIATGEPIGLSFSDIAVGTQVEVQIYSVGGINRQFAMSTSAPVRSEGSAEIALNTSSFRPGFYELVAVRITTPNNEGEATVHHSWAPSSPPDRVLFEVADIPRNFSTEALLQAVLNAEAKVEFDFLEPIQAVVGLAQPAATLFTAFVFVRGMLIGTRLRFKNYEIVPASEGLEDTDTLNNVNSFLKKHTATGVAFRYAPERSVQAKRTNPVCVFHFPAVHARSALDVRTYSESITEKVLLALALTRDASGSIFDCVVINHRGPSTSFARGGGYVGNLLTGWLSGESPETIDIFAKQIGRSASDRLLVSLYKDARSEQSPDFQYVRFWTVLEALAEAREYDSNTPLLDFEGTQMKEGTRALLLNGGVNSVFNLMRESGLGSTERNWRFINVWFAFRTAAAHHGSRLNFSHLKRPLVRSFAEVAATEIAQANGHDQFLWTLKEDTKILLMRRLNRAAPWQ